MTDQVEVESAVVHDATLKDCPLCGQRLRGQGAWFIVGAPQRKCSGCHKPVGAEHAICGGCGCHVRLVIA